MSITYTIFLSCDICGERIVLTYDEKISVLDRGLLDGTEGWIRECRRSKLRPRRDICPKCVPTCNN